MRKRPHYGIDSPAMVVGEVALAGVAGVAGVAAVAMFLLGSPHIFGIPLWAPVGVLGLYLALTAAGMLQYSLRGKLRLRDRLLRSIQWSSHERVIDIGCGRGLLFVGAAHRLTDSTEIGVDRWVRGAVSGNRPEAALRNAKLEGVADRVAVQDGDARNLPFEYASFDLVLSNSVLHEMDPREDRERMLREHARPQAGWSARHDRLHLHRPGGSRVARVWRDRGTPCAG